MPRLARVVIPGIPHHVVQRGNRRQTTFFKDQDYQEYIRLLSAHSKEAGLTIWAYCLMRNHVHLIVVPKNMDSLRGGISKAHRRYTRYINFRQKWRGHLWQERFHSYPMDEKHHYSAMRYVEVNPVIVGVVKDPEKYRWSSARAHIRGVDDELVRDKDVLGGISDWKAYLKEGIEKSEIARIESHCRTGRPMGSEEFIKRLEKQTGRALIKKKPGPKTQTTN